ncbi:MAG: hypothetical protein IKG42_02745 [Clostridia bacterium]|nr:hypothetical protein [Clostridia bacterium]
MKIAKKLGLIFITICIMLNIMQVKVEAAFSWSEVISGGQNFIKQGEDDNNTNPKFSDNDIQDFVVPIARVLTAVGTITVVAAFIILGIKYMTASPEQAAKIKQQLIGVVVAAVVIFGAAIIWKIMFEVMKNINSSL